MSQKDSGSLQHQAEHARTRRQSPILGYLLILFAAAFLLLLLAYFQQQRANSETTDALKQSASAVQSIQNLIDENAELRTKVEELETKVTELEQQRQDYEDLFHAADSDAAQLSQEVEAYRMLFRLDRLYRAQRFRDAADLIGQMEAIGQPASLLSGQALSGEAAEITPLGRYEQIRKQLQEWDYLK